MQKYYLPSFKNQIKINTDFNFSYEVKDKLKRKLLKIYSFLFLFYFIFFLIFLGCKYWTLHRDEILVTYEELRDNKWLQLKRGNLW